MGNPFVKCLLSVYKTHQKEFTLTLQFSLLYGKEEIELCVSRGKVALRFKVKGWRQLENRIEKFQNDKLGNLNEMQQYSSFNGLE
ncbi:hypothetical protein M0804_002756 [Polistes exclamans]|nr:hypothetical protein M0804_002756 [Polistes exclamans]